MLFPYFLCLLRSRGARAGHRVAKQPYGREGVMDEAKAVTEMNKTVNNIITFIKVKHPKNNTIKLIQTGYRGVITIDRTMIYNVSRPYVIKWQEHIKKGNVEFFLTLDINEHIDESDSSKSNLIAPIIDELRSLWKTGFTDEDKKKLTEDFKYLTTLY